MLNFDIKQVMEDLKALSLHDKINALINLNYELTNTQYVRL
jgi:hypothetical protein